MEPADLLLPDDPVVLRQMVCELLATVRDQQRELGQVRHQLDQLLRRLYGPRTEKVDPNQLRLFTDAEALAVLPTRTEPPPDPARAAAAPKSKKNGHGRHPLPANLRRERRVHDVPAAERCCPDCGLPRTPIGEEVSEQLEYLPASLVVIEHVRPKLACAACQGKITLAPKPAQPIDRGLPGPGLLAHVITSKYADHLPLYRLEGIFSRQGVRLSRRTLCDWMARAAELLEPLWKRLAAQVRQSRVIHTDDTRLPVQEEDRTTTRKGSLWVYYGDRDHPATVFDYTPRHTRDGPAAFLVGFAGYLQADAFGGYDGIYLGSNGTIREAACWAHARRKFYEARTSDPARSHTALAFIRQLYDVEDKAKDLSDAERVALRLHEAKPILNEFETWLKEQQKQVLPKSPMGQAIGYALNHWEALNRYLEQGYLAIDNNVAERTMKTVAIGRKNWLFVGSDRGGRTAAVLFTFTATCKRLGIDPFAYLRDVLDRVSTHPASRIDELLPQQWQTLRHAVATPPPAAS